MRFPQLVVYEADGRLAAQLEALADVREWTLHQPRRPDECLAIAAKGNPCVVLLKLSADRHAELAMLDRLTWLHPEAGVIVLCDETFAGLAWDLGASVVLTASEDRERLPRLVVALMGVGDDDDARDAVGR